jgi:hypothetical protein
MAAKSKKVATKKGRGKTPAKKAAARPGKARAVEFEIIAPIPDLMPPEVLKQISSVESLIGGMDYMTDTEFLSTIIICATKTATFVHAATKASASALVFAWACGMLLNSAKTRLGRIGFGQWRDANLVPDVMSERTTQRYMKLADSSKNVKALLEWSPSLRQAYIACGVLPESEPSAGDEEPDESPKTRALLSSLTGLQKNLRLFSGSGESLGKGERKQLELVRMELNQFFDEILA